ncbi:Na(+)-translocating NADH-quinone reductase subunit F [Aquicella siphonis]|uniref:Na(+)-translocating NADH-quinone reductase subunit F n=1 Tax=Aquicella siphonis TaxID=254247 RepID=A0A5E4PHK8_9COXI|nr:FAD-dependent oxidoreductase [Aquicella siphonis]VVC75806.1 Na(+)-translocating NADH-quinone reductase subunit F [Aquicella siphonis]
MPIHKLKLISRREVANNTVEFMFEKPDGFTFIPGQYGGFTLINPSETDAGGITRRFSLLSTPEDKFIAVTMRIQSSAFKRVLNTLPLGSEIKFAGPSGNFICHDDPSTPAVFIAGGIGITPFYSMIQSATRHQSMQKIILFYGNQSIKDAAYLQELSLLQTLNPHFTFVPTLTMTDEGWKGETGFITHTMIKKYISDLNQPIYYVCGSPVMVTALQETLVEMGVEENKIKVEDFPGY